MNLRQLADMLGISQTTASRALNGYPEVSSETRKRVLDAAQRYDYRPNTRAKGLATGRAMAVASIVPTSSTHEIMNPVFADFIAGASEVLRNAGYDLQLSLVPSEDEAKAYRTMALRGSVDGLIIHAPRRHDPRLVLLRETGLPFVVHGRFSLDEAEYSWVDMDNTRAFAAATALLLDKGHRRIALINGEADMDFADRRFRGYRSALQDAGIAPDSALVSCSPMTETQGYVNAITMLDLSAPPTAFIASSMVLAIGIERACGRSGLQLGRDIALVTHDDRLSYLRNDVPARFTAVESPVREHGFAVATMLLDQISAPGAPPRHALLKSRLVDGPTLCPPPPRG